jgi:hypothetical protein
LRGFYVAHLISGHISAMIDGQRTEHLLGDHWTVKLRATMRIKAIGEVAVIIAGRRRQGNEVRFQLTPRWRETDSNFQYASTVTLVCAPTSSSIIGSPSMFPL